MNFWLEKIKGQILISNENFTPVQPKYGRCGSNPKRPFAFDQEATDLNERNSKIKKFNDDAL